MRLCREECEQKQGAAGVGIWEEADHALQLPSLPLSALHRLSELPELLIPRHVCWLVHHRQWLWFQLLSSSLEGTTSATLGVCLCVCERSSTRGRCVCKRHVACVAIVPVGVYA